MNPSETSQQPETPVRIAPWRGPLQFVILAFTAMFCGMLQLSYLLLVAGAGGWLGWQIYTLTAGMVQARMFKWEALPEVLQLTGLTITWVFMLRPLRPRPSQAKSALQVTAATQPQLFELIDLLCWHLRAQPPSQIWLDTSVSLRSSMFKGLGGILTGETVLHLGLPVVSVITSRELGGLLAFELCHGARGLSTLFIYAVREINAWFLQALVGQAGAASLADTSDGDATLERILKSILRYWMWTAKVPFTILALTSRLASVPAFWVIQRLSDRCATNVLGETTCSRMWRKLALLEEAWTVGNEEIRRGVTQHRLPENFSLLMARHVARTAKDRACLRAEAGKLARPEGGGTVPSISEAEAVIAHLSPVQAAASLIRQFVELSRQATSFYYQYNLGLKLHEHRMVADEEVIHENRREEEALLTIRRYFGGMAHPERAMCGLGSTPSTATSRVELQREILRVRDEILLWGPQFKAALQEWNQAWQRRRDLEAAATLSLAGFTISRMQFGTDNASAATLMNEAARQRMVMEHMEGPLHERERVIESRFAAALGMLWWSPDTDLSEWLRHRRQELPKWVTVYEAMSGALPAFRELLTTYFAFQTLSTKFAKVDDPSTFLTALQSVVPKMISLLKQIMATMDGAPYPFADGMRATTLNEHLLPKGLPEMPGVSLMSADVSSMGTLGMKMATDASGCITPYVDAFLGLYHEAFAWLAESAERVETHFLGSLSMVSATEILLPDEFSTQRLGMKKRAPDTIAAWKA